MSFLSNIGSAFRAVNEGKLTAQAHRMAESLLEARLPPDVAAVGYEEAARSVDFCTVEQLAMLFVITYAERMTYYLDAVSATKEFRTTVALNVARALARFSELQKSGVRLDQYRIPQLLAAAEKLGVAVDRPKLALVY